MWKLRTIVGNAVFAIELERVVMKVATDVLASAPNRAFSAAPYAKACSA
jgi:hypothetical protein